MGSKLPPVRCENRISSHCVRSANATSVLCSPPLYSNISTISGKVVSGWKVSPDMKWTLIGKRDPQLAQMFYPAEDLNIEVGLGDTLAARCTMVSKSILEVGYTKAL